MSNNSNVSHGITGPSLLGTLFVGLKLGGFIDWSWWWVTVPFWGPSALALIIIIVLFSAAVIMSAAQALRRK